MPAARQSPTLPQPPTRRRSKPKTSPFDRYQRGRQIAAMRAREQPMAWEDIAHQVGLSERQAQAIHKQFLDWELPQHDHLAAVDETIDTFTVALREAWLTYEAAEPGSSVRVQALRAAMDASFTKLQIMRAAGRAPRSLAGPAVSAEMQLIFRELYDLMQRHGIADDVLRDFLALADTRMRSTTIEGRATLAA